MKRNGIISLVFVLALLFGACTSTKSTVMEPEQLIDRVLKACQAGEYEDAIQHFEGGPAMWKADPQFVRDYLDGKCSNGEARSFAVEERFSRGDSVVQLRITTYKDTERSESLYSMIWHFARDGRRWVITKIV